MSRGLGLEEHGKTRKSTFLEAQFSRKFISQAPHQEHFQKQVEAAEQLVALS